MDGLDVCVEYSVKLGVRPQLNILFELFYIKARLFYVRL